jgi:hypothetical protein
MNMSSPVPTTLAAVRGRAAPCTFFKMSTPQSPIALSLTAAPRATAAPFFSPFVGRDRSFCISQWEGPPECRFHLVSDPSEGGDSYFSPLDRARRRRVLDLMILHWHPRTKPLGNMTIFRSTIKNLTWKLNLEAKRMLVK